VSMQVLQALAALKIGGDTTAKATRFVAGQARSLLAQLEKAASARRSDREQSQYLVSLAATALATLAAVGEDVGPRVERLHTLATTLSAYPVDAKARLLSLVAKQDRHQAMRAKLLGELLSAVHETASSATVAASYLETERLLLVSNNKTSALVLDALIRERPDDPVITKLARGVLDRRRHGRWMSTQENLVALQAIRRYFDAFEKATPNYTGKLWFGQAAYAEAAFVGRSNVRGSASLGWNALAPGSAQDLALVKAGPGRMYYRVGITYAPRKSDLEALDAGFIVRRSYSPIEDPADVTRLADGRTKIRLGAKVLVTLEAVNTTRRYQVALVDPLPAGFEAVNDALATAERTHAAAGDTHWDFKNLRDNRSEAFATDLEEGRHQFSYTVRATTPGTFVAAPAKAEEMYSPETFGRSSGQTVLIE
jgi:alpha-2-macroglobulin